MSTICQPKSCYWQSRRMFEHIVVQRSSYFSCTYTDKWHVLLITITYISAHPVKNADTSSCVMYVVYKFTNPIHRYPIIYQPWYVLYINTHTSTYIIYGAHSTIWRSTILRTRDQEPMTSHTCILWNIMLGCTLRSHNTTAHHTSKQRCRMKVYNQWYAHLSNQRLTPS
jgi:hypothetical protein